MKSSPHNLSFCSTFNLLFEDDFLTGSSAQVIVRLCSKGEDGTTHLIPDCVTPDEFNFHISRLQSELEIIRNRGLRRFEQSINAHKRKRNRKKK
jgi:hypothetical protein